MHDELSEFKLSESARKKLKKPKILMKELAEGKTAQEIIGFSEETMSKFYRAAYQLFEHKLYSQAADAFFFLATLNPLCHDYWLGLGMSTQLKTDYEAAIDAYEIAAICDISSPVPYFYLAKCLFAIHDRESSLEALNLAIETADEREEFAELKRQAEKAREILLHS